MSTFGPTDQSENLKIVNGVVYTHQDEQVAGIFPETVEVSAAEYALDDPEKIFFPSYEVTLIRVFLHGGVWHLTTTRKLDAFDSYWGSAKSFGAYFQETVEQISGIPLDAFLQSLKQDQVYFFLLPTHDEQRIGVARTPRAPKLFLGGIEKGGEALYGDKLPSDERNIWEYLQPLKFDSEAALRQYIADRRAAREDVETTGVIHCAATGFTRVLAADYLELYRLRNNEPNVQARYISLLCAREDGPARAFKKQHPLLRFVEKDLARLVDKMYKIYLERYIRKNYYKVHPVAHFLLKKCHAVYHERREPMSKSVVRATLLTEVRQGAILSLLASLDHLEIE